MSLSDFTERNCFGSLDTLNISHNLIQIVERNAFIGLVRLRNLDLTYNNIYLIEPFALFTGTSSQIMWADFSHNNLTKIDVTIGFLGSSYCSLSFSNNYIAKFTNKLQFQLPANINSVGYLDLSYNNIQYIPDAKVFGLSSVLDFGLFLFTKHTFQFHNNPLVCDCNVVDFVKTAFIALRRYLNGAIDYGLRCQFPQNMRDIAFNESILNDRTLDRFICNYMSCPI
ncbi:hypothetical protein FSP39_008906 [Pinctada imbricata]|uniref:Uncharacterized protein n=1 Tax=Pinctada imbricata TaxID=66713 RepID=A0AA89BWU6_PINIB|nr:hypothetical protein FSP39_008906 [Pinctada imbricata]